LPCLLFRIKWRRASGQHWNLAGFDYRDENPISMKKKKPQRRNPCGFFSFVPSVG
jgi:hypothetical protein